MQDKKEREDVIAKENDKAKILRLEKELKALRKQKATWEEKSVRKLTEDPPESEQETVTVNVFSSDVKVKNTALGSDRPGSTRTFFDFLDFLLICLIFIFLFFLGA